MSDIITFYHNPRSRAQIVHWMLEETGAPYEIRPIDLQAGENRQPAFLAINPMGKLPTIVHRGVTITEAAAICTYLADAFPAAGLAPATDDPRRGTWLRWLFFAAGCFEPALIDRMFQRPDPGNKGALGYGSYEDVLAALKTALTPGPWILGDAFSAADVYVGSEINWAMGFGAPGLAGEPVFDAYVERLKQRPAFRRAAPT